ncbi:MAG: ShlB/FhaC/HecB family hemolysin secretion/activation protein [Sulfurisoma sp.]|nr:ShlB/FhaC/HecB family hemolysin secretion/activation protein [Sulfurisoma sp.]
MHHSEKLLAGLLIAMMWGGNAQAQAIPTFPIIRFQIDGNSLLPAARIEDVLKPFVGPQRDFGDVQRALEMLEQVFRDSGYTTVSVVLPEQVLERGEVLFRIIEGRIRGVKVEGNEHFDTANIRASLPGLVEGQVPLVSDLSASLRVANENPSKKIALQMSPGERDEDIDVRLRITDGIPWKTGLTLDNTGTPQTGLERLGASLQYANLWNSDHILTLQYQTAPEKPPGIKVNVYALAYRAPLYAWGDSLDIYYTNSDVNAGNIAVGPINLAISGKGKVLGARYNWNLKRSGDYEHSINLGIDEKEFINSIGNATLQLGNDLTARPLTLQYNGRLAREGFELGFHGAMVQNIPGGKRGGQTDFSLARQGATPHYYVFRAGFNVSQALPDDWQVRFAATGQLANSPLIPGEQFGVGGASSVRGFYEREVSADHGYQASAEIYTPELCTGESTRGMRCRALAFFDTGSVARNSPLAGEKHGENIAGGGIGLRWSWGTSIAAQADYAEVLQPGGGRTRDDWRIHARIGLFF